MTSALDGNQVARERGSALVGAVVFLLILSTLGLAYLGFPANEAREVEQYYRDIKIRWAAEEALSQGMARANRVAKPRDTVLTVRDHGDYPTRFHILRLDNSQFPRYLVSAMVYDSNLAAAPLCSLSAVVRAGSAILDHFILEDSAGGKFYFTGDTIDGPVHSNTRFAIAGTPIFTDPVFEMGDVKDGYILHPEFTATPKLESGKPQGGEKYRFDNLSSLIREVPPAQRIRPDPGQVAAIAFKGSLMEISYRDQTVKDVYSTPVTRAIPKEGGLFVDGEVEVKGILSKSLTLGASGNIVITDDLIYSGSDLVTAKPKETSPVFLGLISERNVQVHQVQDREEAGTGIRINASIVAMGKSFEVTNMQAHSWDMGTMHFWGTIAQVERGGIGALKARDLFRGFHKDWHYDRRLPKNPDALAYFPPLMNQQGVMDMHPIWYDTLAWNEDV